MTSKDNRVEPDWTELGWGTDQLCELVSRTEYQTKRKGSPYWTSEVYGFGQEIRRYGRYPRGLPLCVSTDHGPPLMDEPLKMDLQSDAPLHLCHSPRMQERWRQHSNKPCYVMISPFVLHRRARNINRLPDAKGTLAFPAHDTAAVETQFDWSEYMANLVELPPVYQPVAVCLYYRDIQAGHHKPFIEKDIPVFTAGLPYDPNFIGRFYGILKHYRYATSNQLGSYLHYSIELGIPFFLCGELPSLINHGDSLRPKGELLPTRHQKTLIEHFGRISSNISGCQRNLVHRELGLSHGTGRSKMAVVLYAAYLVWSGRRMGRRIKRRINLMTARETSAS